MANRTYVTSADEEAALSDVVAQQTHPTTVEKYFNERTRHWIQFLIQERNRRISLEDSEKAATALENVRIILTRGTEADKLKLQELQARAAELLTGAR